MAQHRLYEYPSSAGGEWDERLFEEQTLCEDCNEWHRDDETEYNEDEDKHFCYSCNEKVNKLKQ